MGQDLKFVLSELGLPNVTPKKFEPAKSPPGSRTQFPAVTAASPRDLGTSLLGTPIFSNLEILGGEYERDGRIVTYEGFTRDAGRPIDCVLFDVTMEKNIVRTAISGRDGTVKEYISDGDYNVKISGIIESLDRSYPEADVIKLIEICKAKSNIKVFSWYLQMFGIYELTLGRPHFPQKRSRINQQAFEIPAWSDTPIELLPFAAR
jgi:hypothetical protein